MNGGKISYTFSFLIYYLLLFAFEMTWSVCMAYIRHISSDKASKTIHTIYFDVRYKSRRVASFMQLPHKQTYQPLTGESSVRTAVTVIFPIQVCVCVRVLPGWVSVCDVRAPQQVVIRRTASELVSIHPGSRSAQQSSPLRAPGTLPLRSRHPHQPDLRAHSGPSRRSQS